MVEIPSDSLVAPDVVGGDAQRNKPVRIQRRREKGWKKPSRTLYVGRPTIWGNNWIVMEFNGRWMVGKIDHGGFLGLPKTLTGSFATQREALAECVHIYRMNMRESLKEKARQNLRGRSLMCWCALDQPCHADVLLDIANPSLICEAV